MARNPDARRKNLGFKPPGVDQDHDTVYAVLETFPRGAASDFVVTAVMEFLRNHAGETIEGKQRRKYIVIPPVLNTSEKKEDISKNEKARSSANAKKGKTCFSPKSASSAKAVSSKVVVEDTVHGKPLSEEKPPTGAGEHPTFTELDDDILDSLVGGFGFPQE